MNKDSKKHPDPDFERAGPAKSCGLLNKVPLKSVQLLFFISFLLLLSVGSLAQAWHFEYGMIITQLFVILLPAILFWRHFGPLRDKVCRFSPLEAKYLPTIFIMAVSFWLINMVVATSLVYGLMHLGYEPLEALASPQTLPEFLGYVMVLVVFTGICEEVLFRGTIMPALESHGLLPAVIYSALLFALMHVSFLNLTGTFILGLVMAVIAIKTGSLWGAIVFHMLNNLIAVSYLYLASQAEAVAEVDPAGLIALLPLLMVGLAGAWLGLRLLHKQAGSAPLLQKENCRLPRGWLSWHVILVMALFLLLAFFELALGFQWIDLNMI